ncbi:MAG: uroporphyrinogen-III C-methyltransferase [Candidatus Brocadiales bacterium]|nr:uroporphyrinogen-III C-methyltransferase [Candidatus Bathyanammoxibius sp.]
MKKVYLVGSGPGDPGLITVKAVECITKADVIIYDYLVGEELLKYAREDAEIIYVGKQGNRHTLEQDEINDLIVEKARQDKTVTRLKGGDPFVFGRGGEEAVYMAERGIPFEVVPGITAAIAAPAYAGIPVTHRDYTSTLGLITGHENPEKGGSALPWDKLSTAVGTLGVYMGIKNLPYIVKELLKNGRPKDTPVAIIRWGTTSRQETLVGTLEDIVERSKDIKPPAVTVVGEVVKLRKCLNWFETRPLFRRTVVVTRSRDQASDFARELEERGARVIEFPTIKITEPTDISPLDKAIRELSTFHWVVFTSVNGVEAFFRRLFHLGMDVRELKGVEICAIGPATAGEVRRYCLNVDCQPSKYVAEEVLEELKKRGDLKGKRILMPRADIARSFLPEELKKLGAEAVEVTAYCTVLAETGEKKLLERITAGEVDVVTFTSSSTVRNFVKIIGKENLARLNGKARFASIGPITTGTAEELGLNISKEAKEYTIPGLVKAVEEMLTT